MQLKFTRFPHIVLPAKEKALQPMGSFQCLNGKVDLSTFEAEHTLEEWEMQLERLRQETSVRVIAREISAAQYVRPVKIYAYKNGEGRLKPGQLIVGSSIPGVSLKKFAKKSCDKNKHNCYLAQS